MIPIINKHLQLNFITFFQLFDYRLQVNSAQHNLKKIYIFIFLRTERNWFCNNYIYFLPLIFSWTNWRVTVCVPLFL